MEPALSTQGHVSEDRKGRKRGAGRGRRRGQSAPTRRDLWGHKGHRLKPGRPGCPREPGYRGQPSCIPHREEFWAIQETHQGTGSAQ
eukprot:5066023-Heterocapsa_arctica.AAC.1